MTLEKQQEKKVKTEPAVLSFQSQEKWEEWLSYNYKLELGIWLRIYKKGSNVRSVNYEQALDVAL